METTTNNVALDSANEELTQPQLTFNNGRTTFLLSLHFASKGKETLEDKVKRLIYKDIQDRNFWFIDLHSDNFALRNHLQTCIFSGQKISIEKDLTNGGHGKAREQKLDIYFNFIGNYLPPMPEISEEERIAQIEAEKAAKKKAKNQRSSKRHQEKIAALKEAAKTDPEAAAEYEQYLERRREAGRKQRAAEKARREADPEYQAQKEAKASIDFHRVGASLWESLHLCLAVP